MGSRDLSHKRPTALDRFYYGATYYPEHWRAEDLEQDAERMAEAGINVVRMAEFAWDLMEPVEGSHQFDLFDQTISRLGEHGISTILCTPTATPPRWLSLAHPEMLRVDADGVPMQHGSRQHACPSNDVFRSYSREITQAMAAHFADNPHVVGWQTDNELNCHFSECHCPSCQAAFQDYLRDVYDDDIDALNVAWGNAFWALTYRGFDEIPTPKTGKPAYPNPAHQLDYYRFIAWNIARFQHGQIAILREAQPRWFIEHNGTFSHVDYRGQFGQDLDLLGYDVYPFFDIDPESRPYSQAFKLDEARAWSGNFIVPEQQAGPGGQAPYLHDTPEPDEMRRMVYTSIAHGADSLLFFRWRTCRFGAEEYWCGLLDHDNVPRRRYDEAKQIGRELTAIGPEILDTHVRVDIGVAAADMDVYDAHNTMSFGLPSPKHMAAVVHKALMRRGYAVGCVHPSDDLSDLKVYVVPHWALFKPEWVPNLQTFVESGGVLILGARTATKDCHNNVIAETPPGVLQRLAGLRIAEYGRQNAPEKRPLPIRFYPVKAHAQTQHWYERLDPLPGTSTLARWETRHLRLKSAISIRKVGEGTVIYVGTYFNDEIVAGLLPTMLERRKDLAPLWPTAPEGVHVVVRQNDEKRLWFLINTNDLGAQIKEPPKGTDLITGKDMGASLFLKTNAVAVIKQTLLT